MSNKVYDRLKWVAMIFLPAAGALYFGLAEIWGFPYSEEILGSIAVLTTFLSAILMITNAQYQKYAVQKGKCIIDTSDDNSAILDIGFDSISKKNFERCTCVQLDVVNREDLD